MSTQNVTAKNSKNIATPTKTPINHVEKVSKSITKETKELIQAKNTGNQIQAKQTAPRRKYPLAYKIKILALFEACSNSLARGELLRKEGLYHSRVSAWRSQRDAGIFNKNKKINGATNKNIQHLLRENTGLKKKLAQAEAIIELQKKISEVFGMSIQEH